MRQKQVSVVRLPGFRRASAAMLAAALLVPLPLHAQTASPLNILPSAGGAPAPKPQPGPAELPPPGLAPPPGGFAPRIFVPPAGNSAQTPAQLAPPPGQRTPAATPPVGTALRLQANAQIAGPVLFRGVVWRVYADRPNIDGKVPLLAQSNEAQPIFRLPPGTYVINAGYGRASVTRRVEVGNVPISDIFVMNAGGLRLQATAGERLVPDSRVTYTVSTGPGPGGTAIAENVRAGRILRLPAGSYYVNSRYGDANAFMSGDIKIEAGRLTEVTMKHRAAQITLKLVSTPGGEALANTGWTVLTPGGDTVQESIGAFPIMVLNAGDYTVIARNDGKIYNARFSVDTGKDREVEVLAK